MNSSSSSATDQLLHVNVHIDEQEPRRGILELLSRLRPHWSAEDIQMKASESKVKFLYVFNCRLSFSAFVVITSGVLTSHASRG